MNTVIAALLIAISSLLASPKVQANPSMLAQVEAINKTATILIAEYNQQINSSPNNSTSNYQSLGSSTAKNIQDNNFENPTTNSEGVPILYVGEDYSPAINTCSINASVSGVHNVENAPGVLNALTTINWSLGGDLPTSTQGTLTPIDTKFGNFTVNVSPNENGKMQAVSWSYFPGGIKAVFGDATCTAYFPDVSADTFGVPSGTIYSS